jgi:CubicO group peptidase (beta-lactamase class C family)
VSPSRLTRRELLVGAGGTLLAGSLPSHAAVSTPPQVAGVAPLTGLGDAPAGVGAALDAYVPRYLAAMNAPGLTLALASRSGTADVRTYGLASLDRGTPVAPSHLFQIGSITKSFVGLVLLQLQDEGRLDLQRSVTTYLPWLPVEQPYGVVTLHHLLTHTSGFPTESPLVPSGGARLRPAYAPGTRFHYSNWAYDVLGQVIGAVGGEPWPRAVGRRVMTPLGMHDSAGAITPAIATRAATGHVPRDDGPYPRHGALTAAGPLSVTTAAGSIASTPADMARYMSMLIDRGAAPGGRRLVSARAFELFATPHAAAPEFGPGASYGYGIVVAEDEGTRILRHTGGMASFMSSMQVDVDGGYGAFASINAQQGYRPNRVTRYALALMRAAGASAPPPAVPIPEERAPPDPAEYVGTYAHRSGRVLRITAEDGRAVLLADGRRIGLDPTAPDQFVATDAAFAQHALVFERAETAGDPGEHGATPAQASTAAPSPTPTPTPVIVLGHGEESYLREARSGARYAATPAALRALQGTYRSENPWFGTLRIVARRARLWLATPEGETRLVPDGEHAFLLGEPGVPDRVTFHGFADGVPQVLRIGGVDVPRAGA